MIIEILLAFILILKDRAELRQGSEECRRRLEEFIPMNVYKLLGIEKMEDISEKSIGRYKKTEGTFLYTDIEGYRSLMARMTDEEIYEVINRMLKCCIPAVQNKNGIVTGHTEAGIYGVFTEKSEDALNAAISISVAIADKANKLEAIQERFGIGLCYGEATIGITGYGVHQNIRTLSSCEAYAKFLHEMAVKYGLRILVSDKVTEKIEDFGQKYEQRFLGYLYVTKGGFLEKIYDVYEGESAVVRDLKNSTKEAFERGVRLFLEQNWAEARECFIEVLKINVEDKMAKKYLKLCDSYAEGTGEVELHIMTM